MRKIFVLLIVSAACQEPGETPAWKSIEADLQTLFIQANDGDTITIPEGHYMFSQPLLIDGVRDLVVRGEGMERTILSFSMQKTGAEGIKAANCTNLTFRDFTIQDAKGDNIKVTDTNGVRFEKIKSRWTGKPSEENGAYALYPVLCKNVHIENCVAVGSSDAGIYVGQSDSVVIKDNEVYHNVAGIESENSRWVEIYGNHAHDNTGGILIFDLPGLIQSGHTTRVYDNKVIRNNHRNFAPEGNIVSVIPPGTGIMMMATRNIEVFNNQIHHNKTLGTAIASYLLVQGLDEKINESSEAMEAYNPYPNNIFIHHNEFRNRKLFPTLRNDFGLLFLRYFPFNTPDVVIDGIFPEEEDFTLCMKNNGEFRFANIDAANEFEGRTTEWKMFECEGEGVSPIFL